MEATIKIFRQDGTLLMSVPINSASERCQQLMSDDYVQLQWNDGQCQALPSGAYIEYDDERFTLLEPHTPAQKKENEWHYEPTFQSAVIAWQKKPFFHYTRGANNQITSKEPDWSLTAGIAEFMSAVATALTKETGTDWSCVADDAFDGSQSLTFNSVDIFSALNMIADAFETEWRADKANHIVHFGVAGFGDAVTLEVGANVGVPTVRSSKEGYFNRFYVFGSTRNIVQDYASGATNNLVNKRLTLPSSYVGSHIDTASALSAMTALSKVLTFDDIYPHANLKIKAGSLKARLMYRIDNSGNKIQIGTDDEGNPIYDQYAIWYFQACDATTEAAFPFDGTTYSEDNPSGMLIKGKNISVHFNSGSLMGREFELSYHAAAETLDNADGTPFAVDADSYEILYQEENSLIIPSLTTLIPSEGDRLVLFNIRMPQAYIDSAQAELLEAAQKAIADKYTVDLDNYEVKSNNVAFAQTDLSLEAGRSVSFVNGESTLATRIIKIVKKLASPWEQTITVGNSIIKGNTETLKEDVVNVNRDINTIAAINDLTTSMIQSYNRAQQTMIEGFNRIKNMWRFDTERENTIYSPYNVYSLGFVSALGASGSTPGSSSGVDVLSALQDVHLTDSLASGQVLAYDGSHWVNSDAYATRSWVQQQISSSTPDLTGVTAVLLELDGRINSLQTLGSISELTVGHIDAETLGTEYAAIANLDVTALTTPYTTLAEYGITNAYTKTETEQKIAQAIAELFVKEADGDTYRIKALYSLYSVGYVSALGAASGQSGSAGTLAALSDTRVDDAASGDLLSYNGTHWVNTPQDELMPNLDGYATEQWVQQQISNCAPDMSGYATAAWVEGKLDDVTAVLLELDARIKSRQTLNSVDWLAMSHVDAETAGIEHLVAESSEITDLTAESLRVSGKRIYFGTGTSYYIELDGNNVFHFSHSLYSNGFVSALGCGNGGASAGSVSTLSDVSLGDDLAAGHVLIYDGSHWANVDQSELIPTLHSLAFEAGSFSSKTFNPAQSDQTVKIPTSTSHISNDSGFVTQSWVGQQGYLTDQNMNSLTFGAGAFTDAPKAYNPVSGPVSVNIPTTTSHISEGDNLYFTEQRVKNIAYTKSQVDQALDSVSTSLQAAVDELERSVTVPLFDLDARISARQVLNCLDELTLSHLDAHTAGIEDLTVESLQVESGIIYLGDAGHYIKVTDDGYFEFSHSLYSKGFVSALGCGSGTVAGGSISTLSDVGLGDDLDDGDVLTYDGTHWVNTPQDELMPNLDGYATEQWVIQQGYLTEHQSLSAYATKQWVQQQGYLTAHQTIYALTLQAGAFAAGTYAPGTAAKTVNIPTTTDHIAEGSNKYFTTQRVTDITYTKAQIDQSVANVSSSLQSMVADLETGATAALLELDARLTSRSALNSLSELSLSHLDSETAGIEYLTADTINVGYRIEFGDSSHWIELTPSGFHFSHGIYSESFITALGLGGSQSASVGLLKAWGEAYADTDALSAALGAELNQRLAAVEGKDYLEDFQFEQVGSGNAVTSVAWDGSKLTATKGATFLTSHQSLAGYATEAWVSRQGYLTSHQTIYALTINAGAFSTSKTYDPKTAALSVNIPTTTDHIAEGSNLYFTAARADARVTALAYTKAQTDQAIAAAAQSAQSALDTLAENVTIALLDIDARLNSRQALCSLDELSLSHLDADTAGIESAAIEDLTAETLAVKGARIYFLDNDHYLELIGDAFHFSHGVYSDGFVSALGKGGSTVSGGTISGLADTEIGADLAVGDVLVYDGTKWRNQDQQTLIPATYELAFEAGAFSAVTYSPTGSAKTVKVPTKTSHLSNDAGFITAAALSGYASEQWVEGKNYLTAHQTIYVLTLQAGSFSAGTYAPNSSAKTINIPTTTDHISEGSSNKYFTVQRVKDVATKSYIKTTLGIADWALAASAPTYSFADLTARPTTVAGYGITDAYTKGEIDAKESDLSVVLAELDGRINARQVLNCLDELSAGHVDAGTAGIEYLTAEEISVGRRIYFGDNEHWVEINNDAFHFSHGIYSESFISALGLNASAAQNAGLLKTWNGAYTDNDALSAALGVDLNARLTSLTSRVAVLEGKTGLEQFQFEQTGSGNAVTNVSWSANKLTVTKGASYITSANIRPLILSAGAFSGVTYDPLSGDASGNNYANIPTTTDHLSEGTNKFYTDARVQSVVTKSYVDGLGIDAATLGGTAKSGLLTALTLNTSQLSLTVGGTTKTVSIPTWNQSTTGNAATATNVQWSGVLNTPTSLSGYGIADAYTMSQTDQHIADAVSALQTNLSIVLHDLNGRIEARYVINVLSELTAAHIDAETIGAEYLVSEQSEITDLTAESLKVSGKRIYFGSTTNYYIELTSDNLFHFSAGLYSDSFVSALGKGSATVSGGTLEGLTDTAIASATTGQLLVYDGTKWRNQDQSTIVPTTYPLTFQAGAFGTASKVYTPTAQAMTISIPNKVSHLLNDAGYIIASSSITGNAATATKLQTARTIWGRTFDGTSNIDGCLNIASDSTNSYTQGIRIWQISDNNISSIWLGCTSASDYNAGMWGLTATNTGNLRIRGGATSAEDLMVVTQSGNVGIGTTSPEYKLDVAGAIHATNGFIGNASTATLAYTAPWVGIQNKPTTLSGYGIADAYTKLQVDEQVQTAVGVHEGKACIALKDLDARIKSLYADYCVSELSAGHIDAETLGAEYLMANVAQIDTLTLTGSMPLTLTDSSNRSWLFLASSYLNIKPQQSGSRGVVFSTWDNSEIAAVINLTPGSTSVNLCSSTLTVYKSTGYVGINTTAPTSALHVVGDIQATGAITALTASSSSDIRLKRNVKREPIAVESIAKVLPASFEFAAAPGRRHVGVIAQDLQKMLPEAVCDGEYLSVEYGNAAMYLVLSLAQEVARLKQEIKQLKNS